MSAAPLDIQAQAQRALVESGMPDEAITVNQRALIDKVRAPPCLTPDSRTIFCRVYVTAALTTVTVFRELLQNADDAGASMCELRFATSATVPHAQLPPHTGPVPTVPDTQAPLTQWTFRNNGAPFSGADWHRLRRIAEGNPDPERIGAFGVGFYSLFSICEEPIVMSGDELMGFFWKGDALYTRRAPTPSKDVSPSGMPWTTFLMALREPTPFPESPLALCQFLATSLTFTAHVRSVALYVDEVLVCRLEKDACAPQPLSPSRHLRVTSPDKLLKAQALHTSSVQVHVHVARFVLLEAAAKAAQDKPSLRQTLMSAFSKTAGTGIASMLSSAFGGRAAPTSESIANDLHLDAAQKIETVHASLHLRIVSANIGVSVPSAFAREIERSTKKGLPASMPLHIVYLGQDELDAMEVPSVDEANVDTHVRAIFDGLMPRLDTQGRVFIGFRTHQTTSFAGHLAARFIPTVERESLDFIDRYCARWNTELLAIGGYVARAVYEAEMHRIGVQWVDESKRPRLLEAALHTMRFFSFHRSSPSARVSATLQEAFFACCTRPCISLISSEGLRSSDAVRFPSAMLADFCKHIPVIPAAHIEAADVFVMQLRERQLVQDITMDDVFAELRARPLTTDEMVACVKWWCQVAAHPSYEASLCRHFIGAAVVTTEHGVQALSDVLTVLHTGKLPPTVVLPPTCLTYAVSRHFRPAELTSVFAWTDLSVSAWLEYMLELDRSPALDVRHKHGLTQSPHNAENVLSTLAWTWGHLPQAQMQAVTALLAPLPCIPTRAGMKRPSEAYFASVSLFSDLPVIAMPTLPIRGNMEKMLEALGVRRHVDIQLIFDRLLAAGDWSHIDLIAYLAKQSSHLTKSEMHRLIHTPIFPAEGGTERFKASQLYEPSDALRALRVPILDWPGKTWRASSDEAKFLFSLGLHRYPPLPELLRRAASDDVPLRNMARTYLLDKFTSVYAAVYSIEVAQNFAFVPATDGRLYTPHQVYMDAAAASMGWPIANVSAVDATKLQLPTHPSGADLVHRLCTSPPQTHAEACRIFAFLSSVRTFTPHDLQKLHEAKFIPVEGRGHMAPSACYFAAAQSVPSEYRAVFAYVDFGTPSIVFLRACGVSDEPSTTELVHMLMDNASHFYELCAGPDTYIQVLRRIADHMHDIPARTRKLMTRSPFLLALQQSRSDDADGGANAYALRSAPDTVLVDDANAHMLFCEHLFVAPHDDVIEPLYAALGSPYLSKLVSESFEVKGNVRADTPHTHDVRKTVLERTPLFLFEKRATASKDIQHDMAWLENALKVSEVSAPGIQQTRVLNYQGQTWKDVQRCSAMANPSQRDMSLYVSGDMELDWFEVASALCKALLKKQHLQDVLLLMTVLSSPLKSLKRKGFHVDKILAQKAKPAPLVKAPEPDWDSFHAQLMQMFPDAEPAYVDQLLRSFRDCHMEQASESMLHGYPKVNSPTPPSSSEPIQGAEATPPENKSALSSSGSAPVPPPEKVPVPVPPSDNGAAPPIFPPMQGGFFKQLRSRFTNKPSSLASGTSSIRRESTDQGEPATQPADIQRRVQNAIQASRPDASSIIQSKSQTRDVREAATSYCDVSGIDVDLRLAGQVAGMKVYVSTDLDGAATLMHNHGALERLVELVYRPIGAIFGMNPQSMYVFCDTKGPSIAFNRGGAIYLNFRYYLAWHDADVQAGRLVNPLISVYFTMAHELAHNLVLAHNSEHEFYFSSIAEQYFMSLAKYIATL